MTDLLASKPGVQNAPAVQLLAKVKATPQVTSIYNDLLKNAKGLVFMSTWKAGIMYVGAQMGSGFVVAHLPDGNWSAPAFFKWHAAGGGLTLGVSKAETVIVLNTDKALAQYQSADMDFKFGAGLSVDYIKPDESGENVDGGTLKAHISSGDRDAFVFNFAKGLLFDLTITGGVTTADKSANAKVYGAGAAPDAILSGSVPHPPVASPLYDVLGQANPAAATPESAPPVPDAQQYTL